ncbi:hypothetical protein OGATHE_002761 [Ogataea polymorpha]|uniref:Uncharacterized protein n=1 Tax=Ogataea polymorpha TaxID=460523 RepID=A0A9P8T871_9ASCO|nr:hypothetical protein OGATHE_002761 [Ogataea polymorpha]
MSFFKLSSMSAYSATHCKVFSVGLKLTRIGSYNLSSYRLISLDIVPMAVWSGAIEECPPGCNTSIPRSK